MDINEVKKKFVEEVKLRAYDDKYIDVGEEKEILQIAIHDGVGVDAARGALAQVCEAHDYVLESKALATIKDTLQTFAENDGKVDQKEYQDACAILKKQTHGKRTDVQIKKMVLTIMEENAYKPKTGWLSNWHKHERSEVGLA